MMSVCESSALPDYERHAMARMVDLKRRISRAHDSPPVGVGPQPRVYKDWKHSTAMKLACEAVSSHTLSLRRAEEHFGVPRSTIHNRINKKVATSTPGPEKYLSTIEEEKLAHFLIGCAAIGYPRTRADVSIVEQHLRKKGIKKEVTYGWWQRFQERQRYITGTNTVLYQGAKVVDKSNLCTPLKTETAKHGAQETKKVLRRGAQGQTVRATTNQAAQLNEIYGCHQAEIFAGCLPIPFTPCFSTIYDHTPNDFPAKTSDHEVILLFYY